MIKNLITSIKNKTLAVLKRNPEAPSICLKAPSQRQQLIDLITSISTKARMNPDFVIAVAQIESSMNPQAKASTSTAVGLFQFVESTFLALLKTYGTSYGINPLSLSREASLALRIDPRVATCLFIELVKENEAFLTKKGILVPSAEALYLCHFLGPSSASKVISLLFRDPAAVAAFLFPKESVANPGIFYDKTNKARTVKEIMQLISDKLKVAKEQAVKV